MGTFSYKSLQKRGVKKQGEVNIFNIIFTLGLEHPVVFVSNSFCSFMVSMLFLLARKPDVTVVSVPSGDVGLGALVACKLLKVEHIVDYRDEWEDYTINLTNSKVGRSFYSVIKKLMTALYAKCNLVTAVTPSFVTSLKRRGVTEVRLILNGADVTVFKQCDKDTVRKKLGLNEHDLIIVYSGGVGRYYKLDNVIRALAKLHNLKKDVKLLIIGGGPDLPAIFRLSKKAGLNNNVIYFGLKNDKNKVAEILAAGDVGIIPGLYTKGQVPAKFFEYCACGMPVIAAVYKDSILAKLIEEHRIGLIAQPMDVEGLSKIIEKMYLDREFRRIAGQRARSMVEDKFDRAKLTQRFLRLLDTLPK